jgi:hypothetical protein
MRNPRTDSEIERRERRAPPAPVVRRSAEEAQATDLDSGLGQADILAGIERLRFGFEIEAAAFHQADGETGAGEFAGEGDPGGAGADEAEIGGDRRAFADIAKIFDHAGSVMSAMRAHSRASHRVTTQPPTISTSSRAKSRKRRTAIA